MADDFGASFHGLMGADIPATIPDYPGLEGPNPFYGRSYHDLIAMGQHSRFGRLDFNRRESASVLRGALLRRESRCYG